MGAAGAGKDTVRHMLQKKGYFGMAFADPLRVMLAALLSQVGQAHAWMTDRTLKEQTNPALGYSLRHLSQTLGTEWGRQLDPDFWLRIANERMKNYQKTKHFVFSDVRFQNEANFVRAAGGVLWQVSRPGLAPVREHISETAAQSIQPDDEIRNTGNLEALQIEVDWALRRSQVTPAKTGATA
jgi:hypothetical protein